MGPFTKLFGLFVIGIVLLAAGQCVALIRSAFVSPNTSALACLTVLPRQ